VRLDFFDVHFEMCDYDTINILAAQGGFPSRYPHWRFGMDYDQYSKGYAYGVQKIYEMVINTDPCYAYLLKANNWVDQKIVMAHVFGHADFFKNNAWFSNTNRKMMDVMANHSTKIRRFMDRYGVEEVETFIDKVLSLENLLNVGELFESYDLQRKRREQLRESHDDDNESSDDRSSALKSFMNSGDRAAKLKKDEDSSGKSSRQNKNAPSVSSSQKTSQPPSVKELQPKVKDEEITPTLKRPVRDIMKYLALYAPIEEWQADIIGILREEAYYYLPQRMTKIMNEGWASYWHSRILTQDALGPDEIIDFADHHAGVMQMGRKQLNPYKIGIELYRDIEYRWDTGRFGKEFNECDDMNAKENWNLNLGLGRAKIFEVRKSFNDVTFLDEFLTPEFCERAQLFTYKFNARTGRYEIDRRDFEAIKVKLLSSLTNFGAPVIEIIDNNFGNRGELLLQHIHYGVDLDLAFAADTMKNIHAIWKRPVNLTTKYDDKEVIFSFDGKELKPIKS
jgi:stage V sporulation protein R